MLYFVFELEMFYLLVTIKDKRQYNKRQREIYYVWAWYLVPQTRTVLKIFHNKSSTTKHQNSWQCMVLDIYSLI